MNSTSDRFQRPLTRYVSLTDQKVSPGKTAVMGTDVNNYMKFYLTKNIVFGVVLNLNADISALPGRRHSRPKQQQKGTVCHYKSSKNISRY